MAFMNQEMKKALAPQIKKVLKKYNIKGTIGVRHHSSLVVNIKSGDLDFITNINDNRPQHKKDMYGEVKDYIQAHNPDSFTGDCKKFLTELKEAMNGCEEFQNFDKSDYYTDYFHVGWYNDINIGQWNKPYQLNITKEI
tara:strand:- start:4617 stop:5033 length:417 start_codon:yes stop_codon:yes gene_type:complete